MIQELQADEANFQKAVDDYIYSQSNVEINPEWVLQSARQTGQQLAISQAQHNALMQQSQEAHWQRMNQIQARSNSSSSIAKYLQRDTGYQSLRLSGPKQFSQCRTIIDCASDR